MLAPQRHALILAQLDKETVVSIRALTDQIGVSRETIRKDIEFLAQTAKLEQVRGGATRIRTQEVPMSSRAQINADGKLRIARAIASRIPSGASVYLDNGSSTRALAHALAGHSGLRAFTNDLEVARIIAPACENLVMVGGRIETEEMATFGSEALAQVAQNHVDVSVISAGGLSTRALLTDFSDDGMRLRTQMSRCGQTRYVIVDHEKFGVVGQFSLAIPSDGLCLVFDRAPPDDLHQVLDAQGFRYIVADTD